MTFEQVDGEKDSFGLSIVERYVGMSIDGSRVEVARLLPLGGDAERELWTWRLPKDGRRQLRLGFPTAEESLEDLIECVNEGAGEPLLRCIECGWIGRLDEDGCYVEVEDGVLYVECPQCGRIMPDEYMLFEQVRVDCV